MPYDAALADRIFAALSSLPQLVSKKMFGGICYLLRGNMVCGVYREYLILRLGERAARDALASAGVKPFDVTGRPMKGWVMVSREACADDRQLRRWLDQALAFVKTLPSK